MSELIIQNHMLKATLDISYQSEPVLNMLMPMKIHELYEDHRNNSRIEAVTTYNRFRPLHK